MNEWREDKKDKNVKFQADKHTKLISDVVPFA